MSIQTSQVAAITKSIMDHLKDGSKKYNELIASVITQTKVNNSTRIQTCISTLASSNIITIEGTGRFAVVRISPQKEQIPSTSGIPSGSNFSREESGWNKEKEQQTYTSTQVETYKKAIETLQVTIKTNNVTIDELKSKHLKEMSELRASKPTAEVVEIQLKNGPKMVKKTTGLFHSAFKTILELAQARENIFIYGPTGCGKTHICEQVAEALNLSFSFVSCTSGMSEGIVGGRLLPVGEQGRFEYVQSEFVKAYENGGVFLLDEIDAADPNVLLFINSALANGKASVPNRQEAPYAERHEDFVCVAAANTVGTGADRLYAGRNKLDMSTLDRFQIGKILMEYDPRVEGVLCPDDELRAQLLKYRKSIQTHRLERAMSTRFLASAYKMKTKFNWSQEQIDKAYFSGWRDDEIGKVKNTF